MFDHPTFLFRLSIGYNSWILKTNPFLGSSGKTKGPGFYFLAMPVCPTALRLPTGTVWIESLWNSSYFSIRPIQKTGSFFPKGWKIPHILMYHQYGCYIIGKYNPNINQYIFYPFKTKVWLVDNVINMSIYVSPPPLRLFIIFIIWKIWKSPSILSI